jgi:hypothetical protein
LRRRGLMLKTIRNEKEHAGGGKANENDEV